MTWAALLRYAGVVCELVGFILIALDISERRRATDQQSIGEWLTAVACRAADHLPFRRGRAVSGAASISGTGQLTTVGKSLDARWNVEAKALTTEERIAALEERIGRTEARTTALESDLHREAEERRAADEAERQAREETDRDVERLIQRLTAGNLWFERIGVGLFLAGLVLTNLSEEIVDVVRAAVP